MKMKLLDFLKKNRVGAIIGVVLGFIIPAAAAPIALIYLLFGLSPLELVIPGPILLALVVIINATIGAWVQSLITKKRGRK